MSNQRIVIIGGGIAGLTLSISLRQNGIESQVCEASSELKPLGAGIIVAINALQVFRRLGLADKIYEAGQRLESAFIADEKMKCLSGGDFKTFQRQWGETNVGIHRAQLHQILLDQVPFHAFSCGKRLVRFEKRDQKYVLFFEDGTQQGADVVIGADGIHSRVRGQIFPDHPERYAGQTSWRGVLDFDLGKEYSRTAMEIWGRNRRFGIVNIGKGKVYWFAVATTPEGGKDDPRTLKSDLFDFFRDFSGPVREILKRTPEDSIIRLDIRDIPLLPKWHLDQVCLIGDAAHATTPNLGQGGNMGIEDGLSLALMMKNFSEPERAFSEFFALRYPKVSMTVNTSWRFGKMAHLDHRALIWGRNFLMRRMPQRAQEDLLNKIYSINY